MKVSFDTDKDPARSDTRFLDALSLTHSEQMNVEDPLEMEPLADALPLKRAASRWIVTGNADTMAETISAYAALGFDHLVFHAPGPDQARLPACSRPRWCHCCAGGSDEAGKAFFLQERSKELLAGLSRTFLVTRRLVTRRLVTRRLVGRRPGHRLHRSYC